jgi:hypothetical protein
MSTTQAANGAKILELWRRRRFFFPREGGGGGTAYFVLSWITVL